MRSIALFSMLMITLSGWLEGATTGPRPERLDQVGILKHLKPNPTPAELPESSRKVLQRFYVTEGFRVDLVASDPDVVQPIAFTFDAMGRLWVLEALSYPEKQPEGAGKDRLVILEDFDGDGVFEDRKVFVEGLNLASGFELGYGGVWIGAAPQLLFLPDRDGDDVPDGPAQVLLDGLAIRTPTKPSIISSGGLMVGCTACKGSSMNHALVCPGLLKPIGSSCAQASGAFIPSTNDLTSTPMAGAINGAWITTDSVSGS